MYACIFADTESAQQEFDSCFKDDKIEIKLKNIKIDLLDNFLVINKTKKLIKLIEVIDINTAVVGKVIESIENVNLLIPTSNKINYSIINLIDKKSRSITIRNEVMDKISIASKTYEFLQIDDVVDYIAYKQGNIWGHLFYTVRDNKYSFEFVPVNNFGLTQKDEGYKDFTYFILSKGYPTAIKIGRSGNIKSNSNPSQLELLLILPDGRNEKLYHEKFKEFRLYGKQEWFWKDKILDNFIESEKTKKQHIINKLKEKQ